MREMKNSGIEWIGDIPSNWKRTKLLNLLRSHICDGPHESPILVDEGIPFISVDSLNSTKNIDLGKCKKFISEEDYLRYKEKANLEEGDILFTKAATIGKTAIVGADIFMVWSPIAIIKANAKITINEYIYNLLSCSTLIKYISLLGSYNTQINVGMRELEQASVPLPPLFEQQKIADYLDRKCAGIDAVIEKTKATIEEYKKLKQSVITEAVTKGIHKDIEMFKTEYEWIGDIPSHWKTIKVKWLLNERKERSEEGLEEPLSMSQKFGLIPTKDMDMIPNMASSFVGAKLVYEGDLVFNKLKAHLGVFAVSKLEGLVSPDYAVYYPTGLADVKYLEYLFKTPQYIAEFRKKSSGVGAGLTRLYTDDLYSIYCSLPTMDEQKEIVDYLDKKCAEIDTLIAKKTILLEEMENYKKSVIYEYVTGKKECVSEEDSETVVVLSPYFPVVLNTDKPRFAQAILMCRILDKCRTKMGRVKLEKMLYTIENSIGFDFGTEYAREAAGPLDSSIYECERIISVRNKWYTLHSSKYGVSYMPTKKSGDYEKYYNKYFSEFDADIEHIINVFMNYDADQSEIIATLFGAWNDAIIDKKAITDEDIVDDVLNNWNDSKKRFAKDVWLRAIDQMRKNNIVPKGYGRKTIVK